MAAPGPVTITCPLCRQTFTLPTEVLGVDDATDHVVLRVDRSEVSGHLKACADQTPTPPATPGKALERRTPEPPAFVVKGASRACTLCGVTGALCLSTLEAGQSACCPGCADGNTHPAPGESMPCSVWAEDHAPH